MVEGRVVGGGLSSSCSMADLGRVQIAPHFKVCIYSDVSPLTACLISEQAMFASEPTNKTHNPTGIRSSKP